MERWREQEKGARGSKGAVPVPGADNEAEATSASAARRSLLACAGAVLGDLGQKPGSVG